MQKILILISWQPEDGLTVERYKSRALEHQHVTVRRMDSFFVSWNGQVLDITDLRGEIRLKDFDVVHIAGWQPEPDMGYVFAHVLKQRNMPFVGKTALELYPRSKVGEMVRLVLSDTPYPKSFYTCDNTKLTAMWNWAHERHGLEFPVVVKASTASKGDDNYLVRSREELTALPLNPDYRYLMQECIANERDYRVLVLGGKVELVIQRTRQNDDTHLNNTSQGAVAEVVELSGLPAHLSDTAVAAARALGREDIAGVDILIDREKGDLYVLEVNKTPHMSLGAENVIEHKLHALFTYLDRIANQR